MSRLYFYFKLFLVQQWETFTKYTRHSEVQCCSSSVEFDNKLPRNFSALPNRKLSSLSPPSPSNFEYLMILRRNYDMDWKLTHVYRLLLVISYDWQALIEWHRWKDVIALRYTCYEMRYMVGGDQRDVSLFRSRHLESVNFTLLTSSGITWLLHLNEKKIQ